MRRPPSEFTDRLLKLSEASQKTAQSKSSIYRLLKRNEFPQPLRLGRSIAFRESEIDAWIDAQPRGVAK